MKCIHLVAWRGDAEHAKLLLKHGADINSTDEDGNPPLFYAIAHNKGYMADFLLNNGARRDIINNEGGRVIDIIVQTQ